MPIDPPSAHRYLRSGGMLLWRNPNRSSVVFFLFQPGAFGGASGKLKSMLRLDNLPPPLPTYIAPPPSYPPLPRPWSSSIRSGAFLFESRNWFFKYSQRKDTHPDRARCSTTTETAQKQFPRLGISIRIAAPSLGSKEFHNGSNRGALGNLTACSG